MSIKLHHITDAITALRLAMIATQDSNYPAWKAAMFAVTQLEADVKEMADVAVEEVEA